MSKFPDTRYSMWPLEQRVLCDLIKTVPGKWVIEIGCFQGNTTVKLAEVCAAVGKKLWCIDPWNGKQDLSDDEVYQTFLDRTRPYHDHMHITRDGSQETALVSDITASCGLVVVDGDHSYEGCKSDLVRFWPLVLPGGAIAVHDYFDIGWGPGIQRAVKEFCQERAPIEVTHHVYYPTPDTFADYHHPESGLTVIKKQ